MFLSPDPPHALHQLCSESVRLRVQNDPGKPLLGVGPRKSARTRPGPVCCDL